MGNSQTGEQSDQRSSPTVVKVLAPRSGFPAWGSGKGTGNPQERDLEGQWDFITGLPQAWGDQAPTLGGHKQNLARTRPPGQGAVTPEEAEPDLPASVRGPPAAVRVSRGPPRGRGQWQRPLEDAPWYKSLRPLDVTINCTVEPADPRAWLPLVKQLTSREHNRTQQQKPD